LILHNNCGYSSKNSNKCNNSGNSLVQIELSDSGDDEPPPPDVYSGIDLEDSDEKYFYGLVKIAEQRLSDFLIDSSPDDSYDLDDDMMYVPDFGTDDDKVDFYALSNDRPDYLSHILSDLDSEESEGSEPELSDLVKDKPKRIKSSKKALDRPSLSIKTSSLRDVILKNTVLAHFGKNIYKRTHP